MKKLKQYTFYQSKFLIVIIASLLFLSCNDYLDVDTDKDSPTVAPLNQLLPNVELGVKNTTDFNNYSGDILAVYTHQLTAREEQDQYGTKADNVLMNNEWNNTYLVLTDLESLLTQAQIDKAPRYEGIAQILKAYLMHVTVDLWGDVPYTEATKLEGSIVSPKFDKQLDIYKEIFALIKSGKTNLSATTGRAPGADDLFYAGSTTKWIRLANTLKFKLYNQVRLTAAFDQADFNALVTENNFLKSSADDFQFNHFVAQAPTDERNNLFLASYGGTQVSYYFSPWFYEILKGMNLNIHAGNKDPRIPYYMYNQLKIGELPPDQGIAATGDPKADYWDKSTGFFSIRFGSIGPNRDHAVQKSATFPGIFVCGGRYEDLLGQKVSISSGTGKAPHRILTYDEFLYIQAELMQAGVLTGTTVTKLTDAIKASFLKVDQVVTGTGTSQTVPKISGSTAETFFINSIVAEFNAASAAKKLEIIMTQKWVATFGDPMDQFNDYRRTGYPVLANPTSTIKEYQLNNADAWPLNDSFTVLNNSFQNSMFWPQNELNLNQNAPSQKNPNTYKLFWAK